MMDNLLAKNDIYTTILAFFFSESKFLINKFVGIYKVGYPHHSNNDVIKRKGLHLLITKHKNIKVL